MLDLWRCPLNGLSTYGSDAHRSRLLESRTLCKALRMEEPDIVEISLTRFNALGGYARWPGSWAIFDELAYYELLEGNVIGIATMDISDKDFSGIVLAPDEKLRFRCVDVMKFCSTLDEARELLFAGMRKAAGADIKQHPQGDELGRPIDFFSHLREKEKLHPSFILLSTNEGYSPAKEIIEPMMRWYDDADGNFVEQFQTTGFDQRIWELYLFATFTEAGYALSREHSIPDFSCSGVLGNFFVEAVTVGPTIKDGKIVPPPGHNTPEEAEQRLKHYMPIKFGSPLYSKLNKKYWEKPHVNGSPLVLAVADFSSPMSMVNSQSALERYLWGYEYESKILADGSISILPKRIESHEWNGKSIPSGFFRLKEAENISAVISSNAGTISKFNRLGILGKFGSKQVLAIREGTMVDHNPNAVDPKYFKVVVNAAGYEEDWIEGLNVYHNPFAKYPLPQEMLVGAAHHFCDETGKITSFTPEFHPFASITKHQFPVNVEDFLSEVGDKTHYVFTRSFGQTKPLSRIRRCLVARVRALYTWLTRST